MFPTALESLDDTKIFMNNNGQQGCLAPDEKNGDDKKEKGGDGENDTDGKNIVHKVHQDCYTKYPT